MSSFASDLRNVLAPAVEALRLALIDLDSEEVPASLRRVAVYTGGRLPPPLVDSVLTALDADDWLRQKAVEKLASRHDESAASAFLKRSEGWWMLVATELAAAAASDHESRAAKAESTGKNLAKKLEVAKGRLKKLSAELDVERVRSRRARTPADSSGAAPDDDLKQAKARVKELRSDFSNAQVELAGAEAIACEEDRTAPIKAMYPSHRRRVFAQRPPAGTLASPI